MTTIFSQALSSNDAGNNGLSFRMVVPAAAASLGQVRGTFQAGSGAGWVVAHCAIGVSVQSSFTAGAWQTTATPVEFTFSGASGFNIGAGVQLTSDWVNLSFPSGAALVTVIDITSGDEEIATGVANCGGWLSTTGSTYNQANPAGYTGSGNAGFVAGFNLIETQSGGGAADDIAPRSGAITAITLMRDKLSGLFKPRREFILLGEPEFAF